MKIKKYFIILLMMLPAALKAQSNVLIDASANIDMGAGTDICADTKTVNGTFTGTGTWCSGPLPVLISSFNGLISGNNVKLTWTTAWEMNNSGFDVERKKDVESQWKFLGFVKGFGTTFNPQTYSYNDNKLSAGVFHYRLKQIDYNGNFVYYDLNSAVTITPSDVSPVPQNFGISQNYPNPSNPGSKIDYGLPVNMHVKLKLYNVIGEEIEMLVDADQAAGFYTIIFSGENLASGVYLYKITANSQTDRYEKVLKMVLVK